MRPSAIYVGPPPRPAAAVARWDEIAHQPLGGFMAIVVEPALAPHLVVDDAAAAIDFYVKAFYR